MARSPLPQECPPGSRAGKVLSPTGCFSAPRRVPPDRSNWTHLAPKHDVPEPRRVPPGRRKWTHPAPTHYVPAPRRAPPGRSKWTYLAPTDRPTPHVSEPRRVPPGRRKWTPYRSAQPPNGGHRTHVEFGNSDFRSEGRPSGRRGRRHCQCGQGYPLGLRRDLRREAVDRKGENREPGAVRCPSVLARRRPHTFALCTQAHHEAPHSVSDRVERWPASFETACGGSG